MKFIISEQEKQRILEMHQNASSRQYLMEGVPNTTLVGPASVSIDSRTICGTGDDYIKVSFIVENTGAYDAYLTQYPLFIGRPFGIAMPPEYNVTIGGKPSWGQADTQNAPKIPKGKKATINFVIRTNFATPLSNKKALEQTDYKKAQQYITDYMTSLKALTSANIRLIYNGPELTIPVTIGAMQMSNTQACDAQILLPKGF